MSGRRWTVGELGRCHCATAPLGREPAEVMRGGATPTLQRDGLEHICPTAEHVPRTRGRSGIGAQPNVIVACERAPAHVLDELTLEIASLLERVRREGDG